MLVADTFGQGDVILGALSEENYANMAAVTNELLAGSVSIREVALGKISTLEIIQYFVGGQRSEERVHPWMKQPRNAFGGRTAVDVAIHGPDDARVEILSLAAKVCWPGLIL